MSEMELRGLASKFWTWLVSYKVQPEQVAMGLVIVVSTWHVGLHMHKVEGSWVIASIMGGGLGFLNGLFAFRFFEGDEETFWPSGVGLLASAAFSIFFQYGFYSARPEVTFWNWYGGINGHALVLALWAPILELGIGWLYGRRVFSLTKRENFVAQLSAQFEREKEEIYAKFSAQLRDNQTLRDQVTAVNGQLQSNQEKVAQLQERLEQMRDRLTDERVRAVKAEASAPVERPAVRKSKVRKMSETERRQTIITLVADAVQKAGGPVKINKQEIANELAVARNTIRSDFDVLVNSKHLVVGGDPKNPVYGVNGSH